MALYLTQNQTADKSKRQIKVSIVDDDELDRLLLKQILDELPEFRCVSVHASADEAVDRIPKVNPDLVFLDIRMPGMDGLECARRLKALMPRLKIIMVSGLADAHTLNKSLEAGADNYLIKPVAAAQCFALLLHTVRSGIRSAEESIESRQTGGTERSTSKLDSVLTVRENQVMTLLAKGFPYKLIADQLSISFSGVNQHLNKIYRKLDASNRTEAVNQWWDGSPVG